MSGAGDTTKPETLISTSVTADPETANTRLVSPWKIVAIGNRPHDHLVRDNLFGSLIRDRRGKAFQVLVREPLSWMAESVQHLPEPQRRTALQVVVLSFLCQRTYADLVTVCRHTRTRQQIRACWPPSSRRVVRAEVRQWTVSGCPVCGATSGRCPERPDQNQSTQPGCVGGAEQKCHVFGVRCGPRSTRVSFVPVRLQRVGR